MADIDASNFGECLARIAAKGGKTARQAQRILEEVHGKAEALKGAEADPYVAAAKELSDRVTMEAKLDRADAVRNAKIRNDIMARIDAAGGIERAETTLRSLLHGTNVGARDSIEAQWRGLADGWQAALGWQLKKAGVEKVAIDGSLDREVARAMWAMNAGEEMPKVSGPAKAIAEALQPMLDKVRDRLNAAGARIGDAKDFVTSTLHDADKIRAAAGSMRASPEEAFAAWWHDTEPKLAEKTFDGLEPREGESMEQARTRFGRAVWEALVTGVHMADGPVKPENGYIPAAFEGTSNIAKRLSESRVLFWKDADSWYDYVSQYGSQRSLAGAVMGAVDRGARKTALMEKLGTNPAGNLNLIMRRIQEKYRGNVDAVRAFQNKAGGLDAVMQHLDGRATMPANAMAARINASVRSLMTMEYLGGVGITHFASIWPTVTSEMVHHGESRLATLGNLAAALLKGKGGAERQEVAAQLGSYAAGLTREMLSRWQPDEPIPGRMAGLAARFMKWTGIEYVFDNTQAAIREMLANKLARDAGKGFEELEPHQSMMLGKYGIGREEWDLLRRVDNLPMADGFSYMTPKDALRIDRAGAERLLRGRGMIAADAKPEAIGQAVDRFAQSLSDKLYAYYGDAARHGVVTAGVRERAMVLGTERPGSFGGEMRRYLMQFKMWPLAAMNQIVGREIHMSLGARDMAWNLGTLLALSTAGGYLRMAVNDVALGNTPRNPLDPKTLLAGLAQGGGAGILGDFLFGEALRSRFGAGVVGTLGGPLVSDADQVIKIYSEWLNGKAGWPDLARFGVRHIPFANLVYLKGALDYMLFYHLYEAASPGWWERSNRRMQREQGRTMMGYVPGQGVPYPWQMLGTNAR